MVPENRKVGSLKRHIRDIFISDLERDCTLEHQIFRFAKMILRHRCSTSYDPDPLFRGRRSALARWSAKIARCIGTRPSDVHFPFLKDVSQNCFIFDVVNFEN